MEYKRGLRALLGNLGRLFVVWALCSTLSWGGVGMTMPITPPAESCSLDIQSFASVPASPAELLPLDGYKPAQSASTINPLNPSDTVTGSCNSSWASCPLAGSISEQDGRLNVFLRGYAASQDAKYILVSAVWAQLGQSIPGNPNISSCGGLVSGSGSAANCATAIAQLAVTGRHAFNSFSSWDPAAPPGTTGPQVSDLDALVQSGYTAAMPQLLPAMFTAAIPAISKASTSLTSTAIAAAEDIVLQEAYAALWAIRSNDATWRQYRLGAGWIAVSGEDDNPHRPVNVATAPFPQFDIAVPVTVNGQSFMLTTRYMLASQETSLESISACSQGCPAEAPTPVAAPAIPTVVIPLSDCGRIPGPHPIIKPCSRLELPPQSPPTVGTSDKPPLYILYIHGGGSRLEEADALASQLIIQGFGAFRSNTVVVVSFDLPDSAYADTNLIPANGGSPVPLDASSSMFENGPLGTAPANISKFPVLNFELNFINSFVQSLGQSKIIDPTKIIAVMGGSLGGNTALMLQMRPMPGPFPINLNSTPAIPPQAATVAWSPTSMVQQGFGSIGTAVLVGTNACCLIGGPAATWQVEAPSTRSQYFYNLYFTNTTTIGGLPPDPEMWYRNNWVDANGVNDCKPSFIVQSRFDRYEVYSSLMRLWTTALDTEQAIFSFQTNTDQTGKTWTPNYSFIGGRLLLAAGACDDYDNETSGVIWGPAGTPIGYFSGGILSPAPTLSIGSCSNNPIGNTGANALTHQDIYGFTLDVANDMQNASGTTLFLNDTGHSIHDERPIFFANQILHFLTGHDNNINLTLVTGGDDVRWNSEVHVQAGSIQQSQSSVQIQWFLDIPLNYWFHPWPAGFPLSAGPLLQPLGSPNNPCGTDCTKLITFDMEQKSTHNFTISLPDTATQSPMNMFSIEFISSWNITPPGNIGYGNDNWDLQSIAACVPGSSGSFVLNSFSGNGNSIQANNFGMPGVSLIPASFSPANGTSNLLTPNSCQSGNTNPPPTPNASSFF
ncbi:MAG: hypothetical protein WBL41_22015 [Terracidiphilus sp.]